MEHHEETFEPATLGATPSSADALEEKPSAPGTARLSTWPMWVLGLVIMIDQVDQNIVRGVVTPLTPGQFGDLIPDKIVHPT